MIPITRQNDESVKQRYRRNGTKEVKLFASVLYATHRNNRIVMAQREHEDVLYIAIFSAAWNAVYSDGNIRGFWNFPKSHL
ncbi:hypothetical protein TNCV_1447091 [Trichonephila clavipes]|nr:hypothetical protein TNCV_1447091 [Trichonephila clavipes]